MFPIPSTVIPQQDREVLGNHFRIGSLRTRRNFEVGIVDSEADTRPPAVTSESWNHPLIWQVLWIGSTQWHRVQHAQNARTVLMKAFVGATLIRTRVSYTTMRLHIEKAKHDYHGVRNPGRCITAGPTAIWRVTSICLPIGRSSKAESRLSSRIPLLNGFGTLSFLTILCF